MVSHAIAESDHDRYQRWLRTNRLTPYLLREMTRSAQRMAGTGPRLTLLASIDKTSPERLDGLVSCLRRQLYSKWELVLTQAGPDDPQIYALFEGAAASDSRTRIGRGAELPGNGPNIALTVATGDYVGFLRRMTA